MFKVIVWTTDGSSGAEQALPYAKSLAQADGARLIVVHVNEFSAGRAPGPVNLNEDKVQAAIGKQVADLKQEGLKATLQLADVMAGGAAHVIAEIADKEDLIVAGTRGQAPSLGCCWAASRIVCCRSRTARCWWSLRSRQVAPRRRDGSKRFTDA